MIKILLVDDDPLVLVQLRNLIPWEELGCDLAGEATNGADAIRLIDQRNPALVITDISMPGINGIDLIQYIRRRDSRIKVLAISAYDDFDYVRESLKNGADDYLLKHQLTQERMTEAIHAVISQTDRAKEENPVFFSYEKQKEHLLYSILHDSLPEKEERILDELSLGWLRSELILVLAACEDSRSDDDILYVLMDETIRYYQQYHILRLEKGKYLLLFHIREEDPELVTGMVQQLKENMGRIAGVSMTFVISGQVSGYKGIEPELDKCRTLLREHKARGGEPAIVSARQSRLGEVVAKAVKEIEEHYMDKLSLNSISETLNVNSSYLSRCFRQETGTTVVSYINQYRMKEARRRIDGGNRNLNEVAYEVGIPNYNYFYLIFKETYGITPSEYMKKSKMTEDNR